MGDDRRQYPRFHFAHAKLYGILCIENDMHRVEICDVSRQGFGIICQEDIPVPEWCRLIFTIPGVLAPVSVICQTRYQNGKHIGLKILCEHVEITKLCTALERRAKMHAKA